MDTTLHSRLGLDAGRGARAGPVGARTGCATRAAGRPALAQHLPRRRPRARLRRRSGATCSTSSAARGAALWARPGSAGARPEGRRLDGRRVVHLTSVHRPRDVRIFHKEARAAAGAGATARGSARPRTPIRRAARLAAGWRLAREARGARRRPLPRPRPRAAARRALAGPHHRAARWSTTSTSTSGQTTRTKRWLPAPLRRPAGPRRGACRALGRAARLDGVVTANEDLAARFAAAGRARRGRHELPVVGRLPRARAAARRAGGALRRRARPAAGPRGDARGLRAGRRRRAPGWCWPVRATPARCRRASSASGVVDHSEVPALLAACRVAWIPLQRHGNYDRAVPTKLVEAMAAGRPVVASDLGRMGAMVRAAGCGLVVPPADVAAHAAALDAPARATRPRPPAWAPPGARPSSTASGFEAQARALTSLYAGVLGREPRPLRLAVLRQRRPAGRRAPLAAHPRAGPRRATR